MFDFHMSSQNPKIRNPKIQSPETTAEHSDNPLSAKSLNAFSLKSDKDYQTWREAKLANYPTTADEVCVVIDRPAKLSESEKNEMDEVLNKTNLVIYKCNGPETTKSDLRELGRQFCLERLDNNLCSDEDSITSLQVQGSGRHVGYIPYSNKRLSWHTDGYYNPMDNQVHAIVMHCVRPAASGGMNMYLDPEILYIQLREQNPAWIEALMQPDAMIIPPNKEGGEEIRGETRGPVFSVNQQGELHMRYSARTRNIEWAKNDHIKAATEFITDYLASESPYIFHYRLGANEGVISNNVLHNRTSFENDVEHQRLLYRARYYDRVSC